MVDYKQAREIAIGSTSDKTFFNFCTEFENAFVFSKFDDDSIGGTAPCAVMKDTGDALSLSSVLDKIGTDIHYYNMALDGTLEEIQLDDDNRIS